MSLSMRALGIGLLAAAGPLCMPAVASAQQSATVFAGVSGGDDVSAFIGATVAAPGGSIGSGPAIRVIAAAGEYEYSGGPGLVEARYTQIDLAAVYQMSGAWGYANVAAGPRYVETELTPSDPGNDREGERWDVVVALDGAHQLGPWQVSGFGSYGVDAQDYYVRLDLTHTAGSVARLGVEAVVEGDPSYDSQKYGAVVAFSTAWDWEMRISGGVSHQADGDKGGYGALTFSRTF